MKAKTLFLKSGFKLFKVLSDRQLERAEIKLENTHNNDILLKARDDKMKTNSNQKTKKIDNFME